MTAVAARQGLDPLEWEWRVTAHHEAGHTVALLIRAFELVDITVGARAGFLGASGYGHTIGGVPEPGDTEAVNDYMVTCMAGAAAEAHFGSPEAEVHAHMQGDLKNAQKALEDASITLDEAMDQANALVAQHWTVIHEVAQALMDNDGYLSGADAAEIVFGPDAVLAATE